MTEPDRRTRRDRGAVLPLIAIALPVLVVMTSFAVDLGRQRAMRRDLQANADVIALDLVRIIDDATAPPSSADTLTALNASLARNDIDTVTAADGSQGALVQWGNWTETPAGTPCPRTIVTAPPSCFTDGMVPINAARVTLDDELDYFFQPGTGSAIRAAVATRDDLTTLSLGSTLLQADLGNSTLLNPIVTGLLCGVTPPSVPNNALCPRQATFTAAGYQGLAGANITLEELAQAGSFGSVDELMQEDLTVSEFAQLTAVALQNNGDPTTANLYDGAGNSLATLTSASATTFRMEDVMAVESPADGAAAQTEVSPFEVVMAGLQVANGTNFIDVTSAIPTVTVPGVSSVSQRSRYQIIETPIIGSGRVGGRETRPPFLRTAQIRLIHELVFNLNISVPLVANISGQVTLPVDVNGGGAEATLDAIECADPDTDSTIDVTVAPRAIVGTVGRSFTSASPAPVGNLTVTPLGLGLSSVAALSAFGQIDPGLQSTSGTPLDDIAIGETRQGPGSGFGLGGAITNVQLQTAIGNVSALNTAIGATLNSLLAALDAAAAPAMSALGLSVSSADVRNHDVFCQAVRLAE